MKRNYITRICMVSLIGVTAACAGANDEAVDSQEQRAEDANKDLVCLRVDVDQLNQPTGHPNIDDYNRNKNDKEWLAVWTNSLGNIMGGGANDCSKPVQESITCIDGGGKASTVTITRGIRADVSAPAQKTVQKVIKATGSCEKPYCNDASGGGFSGGHCSDPHFEGVAGELTDTVELSVGAEAEASWNVPGFGGGGIKVSVGAKVGRSEKMSYNCRGVLEVGVGACDAVAVSAAMNCTLYKLEVPVYAKCTTQATSSTGGILRTSVAEKGKLLGTATGWELEKSPQKLTTTCSGCRLPGGPATNPDGTPFCKDAGPNCIKQLKEATEERKKADEQKEKLDKEQEKNDKLKQRLEELKKRTGCATPGPGVDRPAAVTNVSVANWAPVPREATTTDAVGEASCAYDSFFQLVSAFGETAISLGEPLTAEPGALVGGTVLTVDLADGGIAPFLVSNDFLTNRALVTWVGDKRSQITTELSANPDGSLRVHFGVPSENTVGKGVTVEIPSNASLDSIIQTFETIRRERYSEAGAALYSLALWAQQAPITEGLKHELARAFTDTQLSRLGHDLVVTRR